MPRSLYPKEAIYPLNDAEFRRVVASMSAVLEVMSFAVKTAALAAELEKRDTDGSFAGLIGYCRNEDNTNPNRDDTAYRIFLLALDAALVKLPVVINAGKPYINRGSSHWGSY